MNLNTKILEEDIKYGLLKEEEIKIILQKHFDIKKLKKISIFHPFDFINDNTYFEIKSRRFNHNRYKTTMVGYNKIDFANKNKDYDFYFVFVFEDGIYYYKYNPNDKFDTAIGGRRDRGYNEIKFYCYIPIKNLTKI